MQPFIKPALVSLIFIKWLFSSSLSVLTLVITVESSSSGYLVPLSIASKSAAVRGDGTFYLDDFGEISSRLIRSMLT